MASSFWIIIAIMKRGNLGETSTHKSNDLKSLGVFGIIKLLKKSDDTRVFFLILWLYPQIYINVSEARNKSSILFVRNNWIEQFL